MEINHNSLQINKYKIINNLNPIQRLTRTEYGVKPREFAEKLIKTGMFTNKNFDGIANAQSAEINKKTTEVFRLEKQVKELMGNSKKIKMRLGTDCKICDTHIDGYDKFICDECFEALKELIIDILSNPPKEPSCSVQLYLNLLSAKDSIYSATSLSCPSAIM